MVFVTLLGVARTGVQAVHAASARSIADSCALAAVDGGRPAADTLAAVHGASVTGYGWTDQTIMVRITYRSAEATAVATRHAPP